MSGTSLAMKIGSLVIGLSIFLVIIKKLKGMKRFGIAGLLYAISTSILLAIPALFFSFNIVKSEPTLIILSQLFIVLLGVIHISLAKNSLEWYPEQKFKMQIVFIIGFLLFGFLLSNMCFSFIQSPSLPLVWYLSLLWFLVPVLLNETINRLVGMPPKEFRTWQYPIGENIEDPSDAELDNPIVISFVFLKNIASTEMASFRAKAPAGMALGRLFYFFINDYNSRHPQEPISFINDKKEADPWVFFKVKNKFFRIHKALDQDSSISNSIIKENDVLICKRVDQVVNLKTDSDETNK